jgi:protein O-GlcNAc transferase
VPTARLMLKSAAFGEEPSRARIAAAFADRGIAADRLTLRGRDAVLKNHLRSYHAVDIALDPWPYNGTTTTCDALWMGVPVITLAGDAHVSRVGVSLLNAVGLGHLVATSTEQFVDIAKRLAADLPKLSKLRSTLRQKMQKSPLTDGSSLARALEAAYREMWEAYLAQPQP